MDGSCLLGFPASTKTWGRGASILVQLAGTISASYFRKRKNRMVRMGSNGCLLQSSPCFIAFTVQKGHIDIEEPQHTVGHALDASCLPSGGTKTSSSHRSPHKYHFGVGDTGDRCRFAFGFCGPRGPQTRNHAAPPFWNESSRTQAVPSVYRFCHA